MQLIAIAIVLVIAGVVIRLGRKVPQLMALPKGAPYVCWAIAAVLIIASAVVIVPPGHVGVQVLLGQVRTKPLGDGPHPVIPLVEVVEMSVRTEVYTMSSTNLEGQRSGDDSITVLSKDGLQMPLDISIAYRLLADDAPAIYSTLGENYPEKIIRPAARTAIRESASRFTAQEAYSSKRQEMAALTQQLLEQAVADLVAKQDGIEGQGFVIQQVMLRNVSLPLRLRNAIEEKLAAQQAAEQMQYVLQREQKEAERKKIEAEGIQTFQKIVSEGISEPLLRWKGIEATLKISESKNAKVIIIGGKDGLPVILNAGE